MAKKPPEVIPVPDEPFRYVDEVTVTEAGEIEISERLRVALRDHARDYLADLARGDHPGASDHAIFNAIVAYSVLGKGE